VNPATLRSTDDLTLRDVETLRRGLSEAATAAHERGNTQAGINLQNRADEIAAVGRNQIQEYGDMLDEWASHSRFISGFQHAANGGDASAGNVINPALHADLQSPEGQAGLELGARTKMVDNAATESGARTVINKARQVTGANKNLPMSEQNNQRAMAQAHSASQESHADLSGGTIKSKESETQGKLKTAGEAGFAALGVHATTGFKVHAIGRYLLGAGVRESTAKAIVDQLTTARTPQQIQSLHSTISGLNLTASQRRTVLANISRVAGRPAGQAAADYENAGAQ
jgi:hypothetical protein